MNEAKPDHNMLVLHNIEREGGQRAEKEGRKQIRKARVSQLVNAEVNSGNCKAVLASNYATRIHGHHVALV